MSYLTRLYIRATVKQSVFNTQILQTISLPRENIFIFFFKTASVRQETGGSIRFFF